MLSGKLYKAQDKELAQMYDKSRILQHRFNNSLVREERQHILKELLGKTKKISISNHQSISIMVPTFILVKTFMPTLTF